MNTFFIFNGIFFETEPSLISNSRLKVLLGPFQALKKEQQQYLGLLRQLKDYDEELTQELAAKAYQEQEKQRLGVELASLLWAIIYVSMNSISLEDLCSIVLFISPLLRW